MCEDEEHDDRQGEDRQPVVLRVVVEHRRFATGERCQGDRADGYA